MAPPASKVMSAKQAISAFVHDGDHLVIGNYTVGTCAELVFDAIRAKAYCSAPANYGAAYTSCWDNENRERTMGVTLAELEKIMEERGLLYG